MKVLMISPFPDERSGITKYARELSRAFEGVTVTQYPLFFEKHPARDLFKPLRLIFFKGFDLFHLQYTPTSSGPFLILFMMTKTLFRKRIVITLHEKPDFYLNKLKFYFLKRLFNLHESCIYNFADLIIVHTVIHRELLVAEYGIKPESIKVIQHPIFNEVNLLKLTADDCKEGIEYLTVFGRIVAKKNYESCLFLLKELPRKYHLMIVGEAQEIKYFKSLNELIKKLGLEERVKFLGFLKNENLLDVFKETRYCLFLYRSLTQSGALNTALGYHIPVVCSDLPEFRELLKEYQIGLIGNDIIELASKIQKIRVSTFEDSLQRINKDLNIREIAKRTQKAYSHVLYQ